MRTIRHAVIHFVTVLVLVECVWSDYVVLRDNSPVVSGANVTIWATVYTDYHEKATGSFTYTWEDDALPKHSFSEESSSGESHWNISYPSPEYYPSRYTVKVMVKVKPNWYTPHTECEERIIINITDVLNGKLDVHQNTSSVVDTSFVSSKQPVMHKVELQQADSDFLRNNATQISTYWFIDCHYYGATPDFTFNYTFKDVGKDHVIAALVIASYDQLIPATTTTTSTTTTTPVPPSNTTGTTPAATNTTTPPPTSSSHISTVAPNITVSTAAVNSSAATYSLLSTSPMTPTVNSTNSTSNGTSPFPLPAFLSPNMCLNFSVVPREENKTYGYFQKQVSVRAPIENLAYSGTNWIQPGDILDLQVSCNGSGSFQWCAYAETENYNVTGYEKCLLPRKTENCTFAVTHLPLGNMTMVIVITNVVSKGVLGVKINMYSVQKNSQLSVVIVPVSCSIIAAVLIVFGVAYYVQSRARFTVEIADFDFGQSDDLEYKTFRERLLDAVNNAVNRVEILDEENTPTSSGNKYGTLQ